MKTSLCCTLLALVALPDGDPPQERPRDLLDKVVVIGASVSDGYGLRSAEDFLADRDFDLFIASALKLEQPAVVSHANQAFFLTPTRVGLEMIEATKKEKPTLVIGIDFLFWFGYGQMPESERMESLRRGLMLLDDLDCPVLIGDLPDFTFALGGEGPFGGPLLSTRQIPSAEKQAELNAKIHAWAAERANVHVAPLAEYVRKLSGEEDVVLRGNVFQGDKLAQLLQKDLLHASPRGDAALAVLCFDALVAQRADLEADRFEWSVDAIYESALRATADERARELEKRERREERRRRREERKKQEQESRQPVPTDG